MPIAQHQPQMAPNLGSQIIRIALAITIPFSSPAFAADTPGGTNPPMGGEPAPSDAEINKTMGTTYGGETYKPVSGNFREIFATLPDGTVVYREGTVDSQTRPRVFKYYSAGTSDTVYRGYVETDPTSPNGYRIVWPKKWVMSYDRLVKVVFDSYLKAPNELFIGPSPRVPKHHPTGNLLDGYRVTVPGGTYLVYFQGRLDEFGREIVMRPNTLDGKPNALSYKVGVLSGDGRIEWRPGNYSKDMIIAELEKPGVNFGRIANWGQPDAELFQARLRVFKEYTNAIWDARMAPTTEIQQRLVSPHSDYPEVMAPKDPLPPNRSLTIVRGQGPTPQPRVIAPGNSAMNTTTTEYFPEMDSRFKPGALEKTLNVSKAQMAQFKSQLRKFIRGEPNMFIGDGGPPGAMTLEKIKSTGIEVGRGVAGFYIAMGMIAGITLMTQYPENPVAWEQYLESSFSAQGMLQMAGFMAVAGGTYWGFKQMSVKAFGPAGPTKFGVGGTMFMGSILIGAFAGTIITELMADPNSGKCIGNITYRLTGRFAPNVGACNAFWDKWSSNEHWNNMAVNQLMPMFANIMVAGGMYQAVMLGTHFLLSRQFMAVAIRSVKFGWAAKGGFWVKLIGVTIQGVLFLGAYYIADQIFGVGQWVKEFMTAEWSFSNDPKGNSIRDTESKMLKMWSELHANGFKNPDLIDKLCIDFSRKINMVYDCDHPDALSPEDLIFKYGDFMQKWRRIKMADAENAYNQWRKKSDNYYAMLQVSYDFYKGAVDRIMFEKRAATPAEAQAGGFNQGYLDNYVGLQDTINSPTWKFARNGNYNGWWRYVETTSLPDFLLTSMACGPEAEGYGGEPGDLLSSIGNWLSGNTAPPVMIDNPTGTETRFFAPRVVKPIDNNRNTACEFGGDRNHFNEALGTQRMPPGQVPLWSPEGTYTGAFDYIKAQIRTSIIDGDDNHFQEWWEAHVTPDTVRLEKEFRAEYKKMLDSEYLTALTDDTYRDEWCGFAWEYKDGYPSKQITTGFEHILKRLARGDERCPADATHRLANGVLNSMRDEMRLYFAMLIDLYVPKRMELGNRPFKDAQDAEDTAVAKAREMLAIVDSMLDSAKEMDPAKRVNLQEAADKFAELSKQSKLDYLARRFTAQGQSPDERGEIAADPGAPVNPHLERWAFLLGSRIDSVFFESLILLRILMTFEQKQPDPPAAQAVAAESTDDEEPVNVNDQAGPVVGTRSETGPQE